MSLNVSFTIRSTIETMKDKALCHLFIVYPGEPFCVMDEPPDTFPSLFHFALKEGEDFNGAIMCTECISIAREIMPNEMRHDYDLVMQEILKRKE